MPVRPPSSFRATPLRSRHDIRWTGSGATCVLRSHALERSGAQASAAVSALALCEEAAATNASKSDRAQGVVASDSGWH
jgi:hypothetical protein